MIQFYCGLDIYFHHTFYIYFFSKRGANKVHKLQDVDLFDVMKVKAFSGCQYGWEIKIPLYVLLQYENIVLDQNIFDIIQNGCRVNLSQKDFREDWACITFMQENKNSGFAYENAFYKLPETLTVKSVEYGPEVVKGIARVKNIYGLRYYFLPRQQLIDSLWQKTLDFENKEQKNVNFSGCENYIEPSDLEKILITKTECICFEIKKNPNEKCDAKERYYLAAVDHAKKSYIKTGVGLSFQRVKTEVFCQPIKYCGIVTDRNLCQEQLSQMYEKNKPELITQNVDDKKELSKNPFMEINEPNPNPNDYATISFNFDYIAIFNGLTNVCRETSSPKKLRQLLQEQKNNKPQTFYLRYEICCKSDDVGIEYDEEAFSCQNKNGLKNSVSKVRSFSVCNDKVDYNENEKDLCFCFKKIFEIKLYIGTKCGVDFLIPDQCISFTCVCVPKEKVSFAIINSHRQIQTVFVGFVKDIETNNLTVPEGTKRSFEQFKSLPTPSKEEIEKLYQSFIDERNPNHKFGENQNETIVNLEHTNNTESNNQKITDGFWTCIKNFLDRHNGKIIISVVAGLVIGFAFGWIFSPISIVVLIVFSLLDYKIKLPKTITVLKSFTSCLFYQRNSDETETQPSLEGQNIPIK